MTHIKQNLDKRRWHQPEVIRTLRQQRGLSQLKFADQLTLYMEMHMPDLYQPSMALTQSMISDLELGRTNLSLPLLYAMTGFFAVDIEKLLLPVLTSHTKGFGSVAVQGIKEINESPENLAVLSNFPSPWFGGVNAADMLGIELDEKHAYTEIYTLEAFVDFLFSPVGGYNRDEKISILRDMLDFFSNGIYRYLYFSSYKDACLSSWQRHVPSVFKSGTKIFYPLPCEFSEPKQQAQSVSFKGKVLSGEVESYYLNAMTLIKDSMIFLHVAIHVLESGEPGNYLADIEAFYLECTRRSYDAEAIKHSFAPEIQSHLNSL